MSIKIIEIRSCFECPYLESDRHYFCSKRFKDNPTAYRAGAYAEYSNEIKGLFERCPLEDKEIKDLYDKLHEGGWNDD